MAIEQQSDAGSSADPSPELADELAMRKAVNHPLAVSLKRLREDHSLTQEQLALEAGITVSSLSRIERGLTSPSWRTVTRITTALGISLAEFGAAMSTWTPALPGEPEAGVSEP